jgi:hypothetical protein
MIGDGFSNEDMKLIMVSIRLNGLINWPPSTGLSSYRFGSSISLSTAKNLDEELGHLWP